MTVLNLKKLTLGSHRKAVIDGDIDGGSFMAGQIAGLITEIKTVKEVIESLFVGINEFKDRVEVI